MFTGEKAFYKSKGVWAGLAIVAMSLYGIEYNGDMVKTVNENIDNIMATILGAIALYGRFAATKAIAPPLEKAVAGTVSDFVPAGSNVISSPAVNPAVGVDNMQLSMYTLPATGILDDNLPRG